ncbi:MAG TPA: nitrous oxide reductase accessory protein NosL [Xanthomarina sp.]|nr:nitrous oxide reductase accessory protein NosL [Xanthomarina sp.]
MQRFIHISFVVLLLVLTSCNVGPQAIDYGKDGCHFCKMTIVDKVHAAEIVTHKGKIYKFDASECMINFMKDFDPSEVKSYLTNVYTEPETLIGATQATFLISKNVPSPMGAFLTAFKTKEDAQKVQIEKEGTLYTWNELLVHFKKN